jgi:HKD family nuclease
MNKFISGPNYLDVVRSAIRTANSIDIAVAFWGGGSDKLLEVSQVEKRVICNLLTGGTNPAPIQTIQNQPNATIRKNHTLHAKVFLTDEILIIGSANFSTNGLHLEGDELNGWSEAAIATDDPDLMSQAKVWFEQQWIASSEISEQDLANAKLQWQRSRANRTPIHQRHFKDLTISDLLGRNIFVVLWKDGASPEAFKKYDAIVTSVDAIGASSEMLDFYEDWESLPLNSYIIDVHIGPKGGVQIGSISVRCPELDPEDRSIQIVKKAADLSDLPFKWDADFKKSLRQEISEKFELALGSERNKELHLSEFLTKYNLSKD